MKKIFLSGLLLLSASLVLGSCGQSADQGNAETTADFTVMTTFYPMYEFTKEVVGDVGTVELLIPAGTEPHDYEPSAKDIAKLSESDVFVYNSAEMETWVADTLQDFDTEKTTVVEAASGIDLVASAEEEEHDDHADHDHEDDHSHELDPHVWLDPVYAQAEVKTITAALIKAHPEAQATFEKNSAAYLAKLAALDEKYQTALAGATQRTFVTQHAAFGYLARRYDLTQASVSGLSPDEEPSPSRLAELKEFVTAHHISVIYAEEAASAKVAETLAKEAGVELSVLNPLEGLSKEAIAAGSNYLTVMEENLQHLQLTIK